jgi:hypothetical protein
VAFKSVAVYVVMLVETCRYEDGDGEDVDWKELQRIVVPLQGEDAEGSKQPKKRSKTEPAAGRSSTTPTQPTKQRITSSKKDQEASGGQVHEPA